MPVDALAAGAKERFWKIIKTHTVMTEIATQQRAILEHLQKGYIMTPKDGWKVAGTMKLSTRIGELIKKGHQIIKEPIIVMNGKKRYRVMSYRLAMQ